MPCPEAMALPGTRRRAPRVLVTAMTESDRETRPPAWKTALVWAERLVLAGLLVFAAYRFGPQLGALTGIGPTLGRSPDFSFVSLDGALVSSAELQGEVVVLNFWATWCLPCRLEMPSLQKLHEDFAEDGVRVVGLATDAGSEQPIREFLSERRISYPVGRASTAHRQAFGGIPGIPTTFIIDREGVIRHRVVGYFAPPALRAAVSRLLEVDS
jgi:cytochrome c biogenesis protein CcmG, thiol:disulfide interchange protein DsbE